MKLTTAATIATALFLAGCEGRSAATTQPLGATSAKQQQKEEKIGLDAVPQNVKDAAIAAVPGLVLEKAEREMEKGVLVYELSGKAAGVAYEVEVTADGKVKEVEKEDGDDDDDDDDSDDDDGEKRK